MSNNQELTLEQMDEISAAVDALKTLPSGTALNVHDLLKGDKQTAEGGLLWKVTYET